MANKIFLVFRKLFVGLLILPIRFYQLAISPYTPKSCRHVPSCSNFTIEAFKVHGVVIGFYLGIRRVIRCHPWGTHGYDPVPPIGFSLFGKKSEQNSDEPGSEEESSS